MTAWCIELDHFFEDPVEDAAGVCSNEGDGPWGARYAEGSGFAGGRGAENAKGSGHGNSKGSASVFLKEYDEHPGFGHGCGSARTDG